MRINVTGHGIKVTPALQKHAEEKCRRLSHHSRIIKSIDIVLHVENLDQIAKGTLQLARIDIHASSKSTDLYEAIDLVTDKLNGQLIKYKEKVYERKKRQKKGDFSLDENEENENENENEWEQA